MHRLVAPVFAACLLAACTAPNAPSYRVEQLLGGSESTALLNHPSRAEKVEAYRIDGMAFMEDRADGAAETIHGFPVLSGPVPVDDASLATLSDLLTSDSTYLWDVAKACEFLPGVAIRYQRPPLGVDVLICYSCDELEVYVDGKKTGHEDFDPRRADLVAVAKRLFPDDDKIQLLK